VADIRDLAKHLNISTGTVSRALNNRTGVNAETRSKVLQAAVQIGYVANQSGRNLRRGATNTIGFVVETRGASNQESSEFFFIVLDQMHLYLAERGYDLIILPCHSADDPVEFLSRIVARGMVDALVLTATRRQDRRIELLSQSRLPFLTLGRSESGQGSPWIDLDFNGVARRSVAELVAHGHRRIAVGLPSSEAMLGYHYLWGYQAAMAEAGIAVDDRLILRTPTTQAGWFDFARSMMSGDTPPTAIMLCSDAATVGLYAGLEHCGIRPGQDLSIITFRENSQLRFLTPAPACFRVDVPAIGRMLGEGVLAMLSGEPAAQQGNVVPMEFIPGPSVRRLG
jgi:DNA-binding LacI/PurR family transcriptional regulator